MKTVDELLRPRYKVMADYPDSHYTIGDVYTANTTLTMSEKFYDEYPNIFKKLEWWEERTEDDLPEYFKRIYEGKTLFYKKSFSENGIMYYKGLPDGMPNLLSFIGCGQPATEEEYLSQKT